MDSKSLPLKNEFSVCKKEHERIICAGTSDSELVKKSKQDNAYYLCLMKRYEKNLTDYVINIKGNPDEAFQVVENVFIKAYINLNKLNEKDNFSEWIYSLAFEETNKYFHSRRISYRVIIFMLKNLVHFPGSILKLAKKKLKKPNSLPSQKSLDLLR